MAQRDSTLAAVAKQHGGDGVLIQSDVAQYAGSVTSVTQPPCIALDQRSREVSLIADSRSDSTMAHEAGHFLGALNEKGKNDSEYGHPEKSQEMLMQIHHTGKKIPYSAVTKFNYGYRR